MSTKYITVRMTPAQVAAAAEACGDYPDAVDIPLRQASATRRAAQLLDKAFEDAGEPWPW